MNTFATLKSCAGSWTGNNRLYYPPNEPPQDSASELAVTQDRDDQIRLDYTWSYQGDPQQGTLTVREESAGELSAQLIDSWHTGGSPMQFRQADNQNYLSFLGSYPAPSGPDWGWRIELEMSESFLMRMFNIEPGEEAEIAVEATYNRRISK